MTLYLLYRIGAFLALAMPITVSYRIASLLGYVYSRISAKDRNAVIDNLKVILGKGADSKTLDSVSAEVFENFAKYLVDFFRFTTIDEAYVRKHVKIEGLENIDSALSKGRGAILLSAHIGNWELGGAALSLSGYPVSAVVLTHGNKRINDFFTQRRLSVKMLPIEIGASLKACYRTLKNNGLLALMADRDFTKNGVKVEFFGKSAILPKGPAVFGCREGAAIVPTFMVREEDDTFRLLISRPIFAEQGIPETDAITALIGKYVESMESCIRKYPEQWYVFRYLWEQDDAKSVRPDTII